MKEFYNKYRNTIINFSLFTSIILLVLDAVLIILVSTRLETNKIELLITSFTGVITLMVLFFALTESKKSNKILFIQNKIMMAQSVYDGFMKDIRKIADDGKKPILKPEEYLEVIKYLRISEGLSISEFPVEVDSFSEYIVQNEFYKKYFELLADSSFESKIVVKTSDLKGIRNLESVMATFNQCIVRIYLWLQNVRGLYSLILKSEFLIKQQKLQLFLELDRIIMLYIDYFQEVDKDGNIPASRYLMQFKFHKEGATNKLSFHDFSFSELLLSPYPIILQYKAELAALPDDVSL